MRGGVCRDPAAMGHKVRQSPIDFDPVMSRTHAVPVDGTGWREAASPRGGGGVAHGR
jgi:hypothetical protein